ncbi:regulatory protein RecX [Cohnella hongkongensis]|uniref:Regulatory protein RecX n=1 Tax=Cohnella hongkongensis TaxID=178337 RepID=A0ABV9FB48_9BACL
MERIRKEDRLKESMRKQPIGGAVVVGIEAHPKKPHMYRVALRIAADRGNADPRDADADGRDGAASESEDGADWNAKVGEQAGGADWNAEVDALIAGAKTAKQAEETVFTVHEDTIVSWRLLKGRRLTAAEVETLRQDELKEDAYRAALLMLERKPRTTAELSLALKRKGYGPEVVEACVKRLRERRMLDDSAYAKRFTEQRATGQRKGRMLIRQELLQRGVDRRDVEQALGELDGDVEKESALALARKRWPSTKGNDRERKMKLMGMLLRRGFPSGVARMAVQQAAEESGEPEGEETDGERSFHDLYDMED